jgi:hypothetical protein
MIEHVAGLDWSTGKIGMIGMSHYCWGQWNAARTQPAAHLTCLGAYDGATDMYRDWMYQGGIPIQGFLNSWLFGSVLLQHMAKGLPMTENGRDRATCTPIPSTTNGSAAARPSGSSTESTFRSCRSAPGARRPFTCAETQALFSQSDFHRAELLPWYDHHLKGLANCVMDWPKVRFFVQDEGKVREAPDWPPPDVTTAEFCLSGARSGHVEPLNDGSLIENAPSAAGGATSWTYPDSKWMAGVTTIDRQGIPHHVARVVTYTTAPLERDREFTGQGVLHLHAPSDQTDMDVIVKVSLLPVGADKPPTIRVTQGWLRASHRAEGPELTAEMRPFLRHDREEPIEPGRPYERRIELLPMSVLVRAGERLRLEIGNWASTITEAPMTHWYGQKVSTDTYYHNAAQLSRLRLHERPRTNGVSSQQ